MFETTKVPQELDPSERAQIVLNALSPIDYDERYCGDIEAKLTMTD